MSDEDVPLKVVIAERKDDDGLPSICSYELSSRLFFPCGLVCNSSIRNMDIWFDVMAAEKRSYEIAEALYSIEGVADVEVEAYAIIIRRSLAVSWETINKLVISFIDQIVKQPPVTILLIESDGKETFIRKPHPSSGVVMSFRPQN